MILSNYCIFYFLCIDLGHGHLAAVCFLLLQEIKKCNNYSVSSS